MNTGVDHLRLGLGMSLVRVQSNMQIVHDGASYVKMKVAELLVYDRYLSDSEAADTRQSLIDKYGLKPLKEVA